LQKFYHMSDFYPLTVSTIKRLTEDAVAISLEIPSQLQSEFAFTAGQYITVRHKAGQEELRRAYSISSIPSNGLLTIGVKKVPDGRFSVYANEALNQGDILEVMPPQGRFTYKPGVDGKQIAAFAAGSGITPIMSIIRTALEQDPVAKVALVYGNRSPEDTMFLEELNVLAEKYPDRFHKYHIYSRSHEAESLFGHIDRSTVNYLLRNRQKDAHFDRFYLCGPEGMIQEVQNTLQDQDVAADQILFELFTESETTDAVNSGLEGLTEVEVVLDDQTHHLQMDPKEVVLDAVLKAKIDAPYSCQGGVCSTCIARITEGSAQMAKNQILTDSEIEEGLILTCQAHPTSAKLTVDYDDV
jgi:ring-1,2-phenylacetyl-CoA epoxidase subunit PaaE